MRVLKQGHIVKCGNNWKSWKKRYVEVCDDGILSYYTAKGGEKKGEVDLINSEKVGKWSDISTAEKLRDIKDLDKTFAIQTSGRTYTMVADSEDECLSFITICNSVRSGNVPPDPYQGYGTPTHANTPQAPPQPQQPVAPPVSQPTQPPPSQPPPYQSQPTAQMPTPQPMPQPQVGYYQGTPPAYPPRPAYQQPPPPRPTYQQPPPPRPTYQQPPPPRPAYQQPPPPRPVYQQPPPAYPQPPPPRPVYQQPPPPRPVYQQPPPRPAYYAPPPPQAVARSNTVVATPGVRVVQTQTVVTGRPMSANMVGNVVTAGGTTLVTHQGGGLGTGANVTVLRL